MTLWVSTFCPALRLTGAVQRRHPGLLGPPGALQPQSPHTRRHRGNTAGFLFLVFKVSQHFLSLQIKWVRASARKKAFGSRLRQAKRSACPTRGWVKSSLRPIAADGPRCPSALRGDVYFGLISFSFRPPKSGRKGGTTRSKTPWDNGPNSACTCWEGYGLCPSHNRGTQGATGGHTGLSCSSRSFVIRWCSASSFKRFISC